MFLRLFSLWIVVAFLAVGLGRDAEAAKRSYHLVIVGDSLMSGQGLLADDETIEAELFNILSHRSAADITISNLSSDGATTATTMSALPSILEKKPDILILAVGMNDALDRVNPDLIYNNMENILRELYRAGIFVMLVAPAAPQFVDSDYASRFNNIYPTLVQHYPVLLVQGLMKKIEGDPNLTQRDRLHPNKFGVEIIAKQLSPRLLDMLKDVFYSRICQNPTKAENSFCARYLIK